MVALTINRLNGFLVNSTLGTTDNSNYEYYYCGLQGLPEADLGLLQHPRWSAL